MTSERTRLVSAQQERTSTNKNLLERSGQSRHQTPPLSPSQLPTTFSKRSSRSSSASASHFCEAPNAPVASRAPPNVPVASRAPPGDRVRPVPAEREGWRCWPPRRQAPSPRSCQQGGDLFAEPPALLLATPPPGTHLSTPRPTRQPPPHPNRRRTPARRDRPDRRQKPARRDRNRQTPRRPARQTPPPSP